MKNMMLPVKNSNRLLAAGLTVKRSNRLFIAGLIALTVLFAACDKKDNPTPEKNLYGNAARPAWTAPAKPDPSISMTAVIAVQKLEGITIPDSVVSANDVLAAFSGETCLGIAKYEEGLFFLYIASLTSSSASGPSSNSAAITLKYWSAHYTNLFVAADAFPFVNDTQLGSPAEPYVPAFIKVK